jgi:hypothetical protein
MADTGMLDRDITVHYNISMKLSKRKKIFLIGAGVIIALQMGTYLAFAQGRVPAIALRWTPEHVHFAPGKTFSWALLEMDRCEGLTERQKDSLIRLFRDRYNQVYLSDAEIAENLLRRDSTGELLGYSDGFSFEFDIVSQRPFWLRVRSSDWEANLAASAGERVYIWILGGWVRLPFVGWTVVS